MRIGVVGISYRNASLDVRQRISFTKSRNAKFCSALLELGVDEALVLNTCNRTEVYYVYDGACDIEAKIEKYIGKTFGEDICDYLYYKSETHAISHIYVVTCGLDSMVIGEDQILGQVKTALDEANENKSCGKILNKVVLGAITYAKKAKTKYRISENPLSLASIAVKFLDPKIGGFEQKSVMLIGMGSFGKLILNYISKKSNVYVATRRHDNRDVVSEIKREYPDVNIVPFDKRYEYIVDMDVVFGVTASPHLVIVVDKLTKGEKNQVFMDIAVPRDIDVRVSSFDNITLYDVDDLKAISEKNISFRKEVSQIISDEIRCEAENMEAWIIKSYFDDTIKSLNSFGDSVHSLAMEMVDKNTQVCGKDYDNIDRIIKSSIKKIINIPIRNMKSVSDYDMVQEVDKNMKFLFGFCENEDER